MTSSSLEDVADKARVEQEEREKAQLADLMNHKISVEHSNPVVRSLLFLNQLFFDAKFYVHRVVGLFYLVQWTAWFVLYFTDYERLRKSDLIWAMPATGVLQSIVAAFTFTFLPKNNAGSGYFSDTRAISYGFVVENSFFALLLTFQSMYMDDRFYPFMRDTVIIESLFVFFPYVYRDFWPRTRFRDSYDVALKTENNRFFSIGVMITKSFYVWAKHYIGFFLNYARFMDRITAHEQYHLTLMTLFSGFAVTISIFLHTLKFKRYLDSRVSFVIYVASYMFTFYCYANIFPIFFKNADLVAITFGGVLLNFTNRNLQLAYQCAVMLGLYAWRFHQEGILKW